MVPPTITIDPNGDLVDRYKDADNNSNGEEEDFMDFGDSFENINNEEPV